MTFTADQIKLLGAPLSREVVKKREGKYSYIEGWHAIAEANRIFGFGNWSRETIETRCVSEREVEIGQYKTPGWSVSYVAKVRVSVWGADGSTIIIREGVGAGHGINKDIGQAHESAIKEAETDAMKRGMMTFGNPFGLALYDKEQTNVEAAPKPAPRTEEQPTAKATASAPPKPSTEAPEDKTRAWAEKSIDALRGFKTKDEFLSWYSPAIKGAVNRLGDLDGELQDRLTNAIIATQDRLDPLS